jgi:hypothetical protein
MLLSSGCAISNEELPVISEQTLIAELASNTVCPSADLEFKMFSFTGAVERHFDGAVSDVLIQVTVDVSRGKDLVARYSYRDSMTTWIQLFTLFGAPFSPPVTVMRSLIENMTRHFVRDLNRDGVLSGGTLKRPFPPRPKIIGTHERRRRARRLGRRNSCAPNAE